MDWTTIIIAISSLAIGVVATLFEERYMAVKRLGRLIMEILEDREISQEQQEKIVYKIRKILGRD